MPVTVEQIIEVMETIAPSVMAEQWDNVGLQVGDIHWPVSSIWTALDPLPQVIDAARSAGVDMLIVHHPLILAPLRSVDLGTWQGRMIEAALMHRIAVFSAHTNLDSVAGGLNDLLARRVGLVDPMPLVNGPGSHQPHHRQAAHLGSVTAAASARHGLGRVGCLKQPMSLAQLTGYLKTELNLASVRLVGAPEMIIDRVAVCAGSGGGLLKDFFAADAQVLISGDLKYHDAREALLAGRALIDIGHFGSEHLVADGLAQMLADALAQRHMAVDVQACRDEFDPFLTL